MISIPTLVIAGEKELKAMKNTKNDIVNFMHNSKGILIKDGYHSYPWSKYATLNKIIENWLNNKK